MITTQVVNDWGEMSPVLEGCGLNWSYFRVGSRVGVILGDCHNEVHLSFSSISHAKEKMPASIKLAKSLTSFVGGAIQEEEEEEEEEDELP